MSGLSGHMMHPHEDITLTVREYRDLVHGVMLGQDYKVTEKLDGFGLQVCFVGAQVRLVRSKTDLKNGGVPVEEISKRMAHNPKARDLYAQALQNLQRVAYNMEELPQWPTTINCEVLTEGITNVIEYHRGFKVYIHNIWKRDQDMNVQVVSESPFLDAIENMNDEVVQLTPEVEPVEQLGLITNLVLGKLDELFHGCDNLRDVYIARAFELIANITTSYKAAADMVDYIFKNNLKDLRALKKMYGNGLFEKDVLAYVKYEMMRSFDEFDMMVGEMVISAITPQSENVTQEELVDKMYQARNMGLIDKEKLQRQMSRWWVTGYRLHSIEGIVVNGKYKFTGPFGPVNQIMGCIKRNAER
jgi:hypothetical protein